MATSLKACRGNTGGAEQRLAGARPSVSASLGLDRRQTVPLGSRTATHRQLTFCGQRLIPAGWKPTPRDVATSLKACRINPGEEREVVGAEMWNRIVSLFLKGPQPRERH